MYKNTMQFKKKNKKKKKKFPERFTESLYWTLFLINTIIMSDELLRVLNPPVDDESALARMWEEYAMSAVGESSDSRTLPDSDSEVRLATWYRRCSVHTCQPREKFWRDKRGATERSEPSSEGGPGVLPRKM